MKREKISKRGKLTLLISTGGTGGHLYPALSVAKEAIKRKHRVYVIIGGEKVKTELRDFKTFKIPASPIKEGLYSSFKSILVLFTGFVKTLNILSVLKKQCNLKILATGSYASLPVLSAALFFKIPYYLMEQNVIPGKTIFLFSRWSSGIFVSFAETLEYLNGRKVYVTGNPVREEVITEIPHSEAKRRLGFDENKPLIFVLGGSQGALRLADAATKISKSIPYLQFLIQTGKHHSLFQSQERPNVKYIPFIENIGIAYRASDLVIARAGGGTLSELFLHGKAAILVPFPFAKMNHQMKNAKVPEERGGAVIVEESELEEKLQTTVENLLKSDKLEKMGKIMKEMAKPKAALKILNKLEEGN